MQAEYLKIIDSFYWAYIADKTKIVEGAGKDQILQSIKDPTCKVWKLKLKGQKLADPRKLVDKEKIPIAPQTASQLISTKPREVWELVKEEMAQKTPQQVDMLKGIIKKSQALACGRCGRSLDSCGRYGQCSGFTAGDECNARFLQWMT